MYQVLVIDDDKLARKGLISLIPWEKYGMEVAGDVANGALALQFIETHPVDLAVVDLTMPVRFILPPACICCSFSFRFRICSAARRNTSPHSSGSS